MLYKNNDAKLLNMWKLTTWEEKKLTIFVKWNMMFTDTKNVFGRREITQRDAKRTSET